MGLLHVLAGLSFKNTLLLANVSSVAWLGVYFFMLESPEKKFAAHKALMKSGTDCSIQEEEEEELQDGQLLRPEVQASLPEDQAYLLSSRSTKAFLTKEVS